MFHLALLASAVVALGSRDAALIGPNGDRYSAWLRDTAIELDAQRNNPRCAEAVVTSLSATGLKWVDQVPTEPFVMHQGDPIFGKTIKIPQTIPHEQLGLIEHLKFEGCGRVRYPNILVNQTWNAATRKDTGTWRARDMMDGDTLAEPKLQQDVGARMGLALFTYAQQNMPDCTLAEMKRTVRPGTAKVLSELSDAHTWSELWPIRMCGKDFSLRIDFKPNPAGPGTLFEFKLDPDSPKP